MTNIRLPVRTPEDLVFRLCYAPVRLQEMLSSAETRSRIRTLSTSQVFFGLDELDDQQIRTLLPHLTETQWAGILDLDLWSRDQVQIGRFLYWQRYILTAVPAVARKLLRASDPELWQLAFKRRLEIYRRNPEDTYPDVTGDGEQMETPDGQYMISLPDNEEEARLIRALLLHLYELEPQNACLLLEASLAATSIQLEEAAYQQRIRRTESLGYQDYFRAIDLYTPLEPQELLPQKTWEIHSPAAFLPTQLVPTVERPSLLFEAATALSSQTEIHSFLEELLFVCNKIISADRIPVGEADPVRKAISKAICGINLGLDIWCQSDPERATEGLRRHYLQSFFQIGYGCLMRLQSEARTLEKIRLPEPGSLLESILEQLLSLYPQRVVLKKGKFRTEFYTTRDQLQESSKQLSCVSR